ncbi:galactosylceramide sulfotransferase-like [Strongylocentrotus purpuratus]|uniref:Galactosylceramide sulfotransferase-like n=1 Tax=Strongylocentrotus purpuratus TaxID=7668 RepID=A0A7M7PWR8_STRPU|nr:galactosylceramide sulfotransferase-like [Strongylocentrotus purpuratus]
MKQKHYLVLSIPCLTLLVYVSFMVGKDGPTIFKRQVMTPSKTRTSLQPMLQRKCVPVSSVVSIKTHKTGGTTISSILNRYGERHNFSFLANRHDPTTGHFRTVLVENKTILPPLGVLEHDYTNYQNYNLMTFHIIFLKNEERLKQFMSPEPRFITILRDPTKQWESAFFFFEGYNTMRVPGVKPIEKLNNFFKRPLTYWGKRGKGFFKSQYRNGQWVDILGSSRSINNNMTHVEELIKELEKKLQLVLLTDYIDESLVLLKRLLCWEFEDLLYVKMNQRPSDLSAVMSEDQREKIREWNKADMILYDHYNRTLLRKIADIGPNFYKDLDAFREMLDSYGRWCNITMKADKVRKVPVTTNSSALCQRLVADRTKCVQIMMEHQRNQLTSPLMPLKSP